MKHRKYIIDSKPHKVSDAMAHALLAKHPKLEYIVGMDAKFFYKPMSHVPVWIADLILSWPRHYGPLAEEYKM